MTPFFRRLCYATFILAASSAPAANSVPGIEVVTMQGASVVHRAITDGKGRFETGPLAPGVYRVEVRTMPNTPPTAARFFLALAGAKPLGDATIRPGVALAMDAMVRNPNGIRGQVTARGGIVYVPKPVLNASGSPAPTLPKNAPPAGNSVVPSANGAPQQRLSPESDFVRRPASAQPKIINGRRYVWVQTTAGSNIGRWMPERGARPVGSPSPSPRPTLR